MNNNPCTEPDKYYVFGIWNDGSGALVIKNNKPDISVYDTINDANNEISVKVGRHAGIIWCISRSEPKYYEMITQTMKIIYKITCN